jgi:myo-inositol 2-dehydrogenase/D-chiro-inositol 1-dehydrogenase
MRNRLNIAVIGTGRMGSVHVRNLVRKIPEANLVALCDIRLDVAQALADELGVPRVVADYHELLADPDIPAVLIATSTDTHWFIIRDAALAGKQIFCEKPLALDLPSIDIALAAVEQAGASTPVSAMCVSWSRQEPLAGRACCTSSRATPNRHRWNMPGRRAACSWT